MSLWSNFLSHKGRPVFKWPHYFPCYERHMSRFVNQPVTLLEIGCGEGGSLQLWKSYLGPHSTIIGIDNNPACQEFEEKQVHVRIGSQSDVVFLATVVNQFGPPDIIIDDGSHMQDDLCASFDFLYPRMSPTGVYIAEDLHTSYWQDYQGGLGKQGTFIEKTKVLIDQLNGHFNTPTEFTRTTLAMHFYDSMVVFEKGRHESSQPLCVGER